MIFFKDDKYKKLYNQLHDDHVLLSQEKEILSKEMIELRNMIDKLSLDKMNYKKIIEVNEKKITDKNIEFQKLQNEFFEKIKENKELSSKFTVKEKELTLKIKQLETTINQLKLELKDYQNKVKISENSLNEQNNEYQKLLFNYKEKVEENDVLSSRLITIEQELSTKIETLKKENKYLSEIVLPGISTNEKKSVKNDKKSKKLFSFEKVFDYYLINRYIGFNDEKIEIPSEYKGEKVIGIGKGAFENCIKIKEIKMSDNITSIGDNCFKGCSSLERIELSKGIIIIGENAFDRCISLNEIVLPNSIRYISDYCFNQTNIKNITIPDNLIKISRGMFQNCIKLEKIIIPNGVERIEPYAFNGCINLIDVELPKSLSYIDGEAFANCYKLLSIDIPDHVLISNKNVFSNTYIYQPDKRYNPVKKYRDREMTILCNPGSYAQEYARDNKFSLINSTKVRNKARKIERPYYLEINICTNLIEVNNIFNDLSIHYIPILGYSYHLGIIFFSSKSTKQLLLKALTNLGPQITIANENNRCYSILPRDSSECFQMIKKLNRKK